MTVLTTLSPAASYGDLLTTTNNGGGLDSTLRAVQDGFGNNSAIQLSTASLNVTGTFQVGGVDYTPSIRTLAASVAAFADIRGMYAAPISILASPGIGLMHVVHRFSLEIVSTGFAAYLLGGNVYLQYGATANGAGTNYATPSTAIPNTFIQQAANRAISVPGEIGDSGGLATLGACGNAAITLTNTGAAFTTGTGTLRYVLWYSTVSIT